MFFLLPLLPAIGAALTSTEIITGVITAVGVGVTIKGAVDYHDAKKTEAEALEDYESQKALVNRELNKVNSAFEKFGMEKIAAYNGVLKRSVTTLLKYRNVTLSKFKPGDLGKIRYLDNDIQDFFGTYHKDTNRLSMNSSLSLQRLGAFGLSGSFLNNSISLIGQSLSFAISGSRAKTQALQVSSVVKIEREKMEDTIALCRCLRKRIAEGSSVLQSLTNKMSSIMEDLKLPIKSHERERRIDALLCLSKTMKKVIDTEICTTEGVLLEKAGLLYLAVNIGDSV